MKRGLLLTVSLLAIASMAFAQAPDGIGIFADVSGATCDLVDGTPGLYNVYVVHVHSPGANASQFRVTFDPGMNMTPLSEAVTAPYIKIGTCLQPGLGCAIAYGSCQVSPFMILTLGFFAQGVSANDVFFHVVPDSSTTPPLEDVWVTDCSDPTPLLLTAHGGEAILNNTGDPCDVPVHETTWGRIKSLYR
jgi:hypothetical protein